MAFPATPLDVEVSLALGADIHAAPATWTWTDITSYVRENNRISIRRGRTSEAGVVGPSTCRLTVDNTDGRFCRHNPVGTWYGQIGKNTPLRVRVNNGSGYVTRFVGHVVGWPPTWDPSESDQTVTLPAEGVLRRLLRNKPLRSALYRTLAGVAPNDYVPHAYWPMEDGTNATAIASGLANGSTARASGIAYASSNKGLAGSAPLPTLSTGANLYFPIPTYTNTNQWVVQAVVNLPSAPAAETTLFEITATSGSVATWRVTLNPNLVFPPALDLRLRGFNSSGTAVIDDFATLETESQSFGIYGNWVMVMFAAYQNGSNITYRIGNQGPHGDDNTVGGSVAGTHGPISAIRLNGAGTGLNGAGFGHVVVFTDSAFTVGSDDLDNAAAMDGWAGEMAHKRVQRLCDEERIPVTITATTSQAMGAQGTDKLVTLLRECAATDFGLLYEPKAGGLGYKSSSQRYNASAAITLTYTSRHVSPPWNPVDDDRDFHNDVVATRTDGSFARVADEDSIDDVGAYELPLAANTETDDQLLHIAGWGKNLGVNDELRWPAVKPNLLDNPSLINTWMTVDLGDQLHVTGHPSPLAPDTIKQIVEGYDEVFGSFEYSVTANLSPASPWTVAKLDDDDLGKLDTAGCELMVAAASGATSLTVHTTDLPRWTTDAGEMPIPILVSGQVNSATAISNVTVSFVAAGTAAHGDNASVSPGLPAGLAAGDLLLCWAAIRNSGTGTVNTPSGWTLLVDGSNARLFGKYATASEVAPTITFTGGVASADTSAQLCAFRGVGRTVHASQAQLNSSAQDVAYPALDISRANCVVLYLGWKQDDWTSVTSPGTEIGEPDTSTGGDQGIVWAYTIQTTATPIAAGSFTVTGGASAISRGAVVALASDVQTMTVTRGTNGVTKALAVGAAINVHQPARLAL